MSTAVDEFGKLNVLVNNAGMVALGKLGQFDVDKWNKVIDVNLNGTFHGIQAVVEPMKAAGGGSIINVSSIEGLRGAVMVPYVASKWAVRGLTKSASLELASQGIRVNSIHPGFIRTPMTKHFPDDMVTVPLGRPASPRRSRPSCCSWPVTNRRMRPALSSSWTAAWLTTSRTSSNRARPKPLTTPAITVSANRSIAARQPSRSLGSTPSPIQGAHITAVMPISSARRRDRPTASRERQHDLEWLSVAAVFAPQRRQLLHVADRVVPDVCGADPAIAQPSRPAQRHFRFAAAQDRHRGRRMRLEHQRGHLVVPPAPRHPAALPQRSQRRDHLVEPLATAAEILSQQLEFLAHPTGADGQRYPAAGDHRRGRHLFGDLDERPGGRDVDGVGKPQPPRGR